jgi:hypothetical protein
MPRITKNPVVFLALSPAALATALGISTKQVADAILLGYLPVHALGTKRRIWIADAEKWFRTHWRIAPTPQHRKKKDQQP